ncbi:response regulator [Pseudooceanicola nanhaiensis]|uniref:response regulator n=1 Tax=Pseudooceanicola nanhaiensis TaxID=375761 RepID=UPI001CD6D358|nr:response regulator [Pseudooceanicola nanhaiensis]MCA0919646.1 response regulator [Pseudooceanicola nanhaiensis]
MIPAIIVDDVLADRYIVRRRLSKSGAFCPVGEAQDGQSFLSTYLPQPGRSSLPEGNAPCLLLVDINMPGLNGFEMIEEMGRRLRDIPAPNPLVVMMFTSSDNPEDKRRAAEQPLICRYLLKPMTDAAVAQILQDYTARGYAG